MWRSTSGWPSVLVKPGNDLSRGCTAEDVVNTVILSILQTAL